MAIRFAKNNIKVAYAGRSIHCERDGRHNDITFRIRENAMCTALFSRALDGIRTHTGAGLSRLPLPLGYEGCPHRTCVILMVSTDRRR